MNRMKYHVFFRRVSTAGQDLAMQTSADAPFREKLLPDEIMTIDENAISANKKTILERPEMQKVISLIKRGEVHTLYAFDRTRLFRDYYEAMEFNDLRTKYGVNLIFTSEGNGHIQANDNIFLEGILNLFSDVEGKNIARRTKEAQRRYPAKKLGYIKFKETKQFKKDPAKQESINQFFSSLIEITVIEELGVLLAQFRKKLGRSDKDLIKLAKDPFYAGYDLCRGENKLNHVEPYINLGFFKRLQQEKGSILEVYMSRLQQLEKQNTFEPICGTCHSPMRYQIDKLNNIGFYTCSKGHKKVSITFIDISNIIQLVLLEVITNLNTKMLLNHSAIRIREIRKQLEKEINTINYQLDEVAEQIFLSTDSTTCWEGNPLYGKLKRLKEEKNNLIEELDEKEKLFKENKAIGDCLKESLDNSLTSNHSLLYAMFINRILIFPNEIDLEIRKFDYLGEIQTDFVYTGEAVT